MQLDKSLLAFSDYKTNFPPLAPHYVNFRAFYSLILRNAFLDSTNRKNCVQQLILLCDDKIKHTRKR